MIGAQWLLLCFVEADDAPHLLAALTAAGCGATERLGQGGPAAQGRVGVLVVASPGEVPLALAAVRRTCARRMAGHRHAALAMMLNPLAEVIGGATILALPVRNSARWALGDLPSARGGARRWEMLDAAVLEAEAISLARDQPTKLLVAVVPDRSAERVIQALAMRQCRAIVVGSTGGIFRSGNTTLVADVPAERAQLAAEAIRTACVASREPDAPEQGIAFALDVSWQVQL